MKDAKTVAAAGALRNIAPHEHQGLHRRIVFQLCVGDAKFARLGRRRGSEAAQHRQQ